MDYQIALSPDLNITPEEFADAWNDTVETRNAATVRLAPTKGAQFLDPLLAGALLSVPASVASSAIYELIKDVIHRLQKKKGQAQTQVQAPHKHIHIEQTEKNDGTKILVIDIDE